MKIMAILCFLLVGGFYASNVPIIFLHGHKSEAMPYKEEMEGGIVVDIIGGWTTWYPINPNGSLKYHTAMTKIIDSHYSGYSAGSPLNCSIDSTPRPTGGETRKVYNFSYYHPAGNPGVISLSEESIRVYVSHGYNESGDAVITVFTHPPSWGYDLSAYWPKYVPGLVYTKVSDPTGNIWFWGLNCSNIAYDWINSYVNSWKTGKFAKRLAEFIDKVLTATGASKVDIVAHSMGGVIARATIKNYGCADKVRKLLMVGTPNHTFADWFEQWVIYWPGDKEWQKKGEDAELGVSVFAGFTDLSTSVQHYWHDFLGYGSYVEGMSTIAGNKGTSFYGNKPNDGVVAVEQVHLSSAQFNPVIYASHSYGDEPELALTTCTYTEEFIKNWLIDDDVSHNGASVAGSFAVYDSIPVNNWWNDYELGLLFRVNDYDKTLTALTQTWACGTLPGSGQYIEILLGAKSFPLHEYYRYIPGNPILAHDPAPYIVNMFYPNIYKLKIKSRVYDMDGLITEDVDDITISWSDLPEKCDVEVTSPVDGDIFTIQGAWDKLTVKVKTDFYMAQNFYIYFSPHEAGSLTPVWTATNYHGGGETKTIQFAMPQVNSPYCRVFVKAKLDNFTEKEYVSDYFTIKFDAPSDLYAFTVDESKVGLDWKCGTLLGFEVQRMKTGQSWQTIGTGYWGPGSKSFFDETIERNTTYYYRIRAFGVFQGQTYYSDFCDSIAVVTPRINPPYPELRVHSPASDRVIVQFLDESNVETHFELERKCPETGEIWHVEATLPAAPQGGWQIYQDDNVKPESTYFYRARAYTSTPPAGYSSYTGVYGVTVVPHLKTSRDSATAFQPKMLYDQNTNAYWMSYSAESLLLASRSTDGLNWEGVITACYWGQAMDEKDAGFCQLDLKENGLPVMVFSYRNRKLYHPNPKWYSTIHFAYYDPDSTDWIDSIALYTKNFDVNDPPPFFPFAFRLINTLVHLVYVENNTLRYTTYDYAALPGHEFGDTLDLGDAAPSCCPVMERDDVGNLYCAWLSYDGCSIYYQECINGNWSTIDTVPVPWITQISQLSLMRINGKTHIVSISQEPYGPGYTMEDCYLFYSVKDGANWQTEHVIGDQDTLAGAGKIVTENLLLYNRNRRIADNWDIYYQEKVGTGWSNPICVKNTAEKSKFPQGVFDGENMCLIWTEGDAVPYQIDTAKIRVVPELIITYPTISIIPGGRLRAGLPLLISWNSSDNVGVASHRIFYSLDYGNTYVQIGGALPGSTQTLDWTVPDTMVTGLVIRAAAFDGAGMSCIKEAGPFRTTKEFVFNPNFEEIAENAPYLWTPYGTGQIFEADWQEVQNGQFSAHISRSAAADYFGFYQAAVPVEPNKLYWMQGYIKTAATAGSANLAFGVWSSNPEKNHHQDFGNISGTTDWTYICDSLRTRADEDTIRVMVYGNPAFIGDAWFDNLNLLIDTVSPQVIVSYPNGGESLFVEQKIEIYWYTTDNVKIGSVDSVLYSTDTGQSWNVIAAGLPAMVSSCEWTIPVWCQQYKIRVVASDASGNRSRDESDVVFGTKYFAASGFEYTDPPCLENTLVGSQGVTNSGAIRVSGYTNGVGSHTGNFMYKIWGTDTATTQNSYVIFKVFPYDFIIEDSTYLSFWLWIEEAPTDSGHICLDAYTKDGQILRAWNRFGYILDQTGQRIHPALHWAPKGQWCQYVFTFNPAVCETISDLHLIYDDRVNTETGYFEGYIDDIEVLDSFPIPKTWHAEKFPVGSPPNNPDNYDPNFYMNFVIQNDSTKLIIKPQGDGGEGAHWVAPTPGLRNDITDIAVAENTTIFWRQYDQAHSLILSVLVHDNLGEDRWLTYAKNANNHWYKDGWVDMGDPEQHYNTWQWFYRNIRDDYIAEYGEGVPPNGVEPEYIKEMRLEHFAQSDWTGDHGGTIRNLFIGVDTIAPVVQILQPNGSEKLEIGSVYPVTWETDDNLQIGLQSVYYSTDNGANWSNVSQPDTLFEPIASYQYNWQVPPHPSDNCLVRVISKDIANNAGQDISNNPYSICWLTSSDTSATAGNGERTVYDEGKLHFVFTSGDSIFYSYSTNEGASWEIKQLIDLGTYPAIGIDHNHRVHLVYKKDHSFYYKELTGTGNPVCFYTTSNTLQSPSFFVVDNRGHLAFEEREYAGTDPISHLMHGYFNFDAPGNFIVQEVLSDNEQSLTNPHLVVYQSYTPHIIYEKAGEVYYIAGDAGSLRLQESQDLFTRTPSPLPSPARGEDNWTEPLLIGTGQNPRISLSDEVIDVVWEDQGEIKLRKKWYYSEFGAIENISNTPDRRSKDPVIFSPSLVMWLEEPEILPDSKFDLVYSVWQRDGWTTPVILTENSELAYSPRACLVNNVAYAVWTYGNDNQSRYGIKSTKTDLTMLLPYRTSDTKLATAGNNAKRLVLDNDDKLHILYRAGDYIYYTYDNTDRVFAGGAYPAASFSQDEMHAVWITGSILPPHSVWYRRGINEQWQVPMIIWSRPGLPNYRLLPPSFTASQDTGFTVIEEEQTLGQILYWKLYFLKFPLTDPLSVTEIILDSAQVTAPPQWPPEEETSTPSIILDDYNNPHIVWSDKYGHLQYTCWNGTEFTPKRDLTAGYIGTLNAKRPCLDKYKNRLSVVFELFNDVYFTYKTLLSADKDIERYSENYPSPLPSPTRGEGILGGSSERFDWQELQNISSSADSSMAPVILCGSQVFYGEKISGKWQIFQTGFDGFEWSTPVNISNTMPADAYYVQAVAPLPYADKSTEGRERALSVPIQLVWTGGYENGGGPEYRLEPVQITGYVPDWQSGELTENTTWQGDIFVTGDVSLNPRIDLTIMPGTRVYFFGQDDQINGLDTNTCELIIRGNLYSLGNDQDSICYLVYPDTIATRWFGIRCTSSSQAQFEFSQVKDAMYSISFDESEGLLVHSLVQGNDWGIRALSSQLMVKNSDIRENGGVGITGDNSSIVLDSNYIYRNDGGGNGGGPKVRAKVMAPEKKPKARGDTLIFSCTGIILNNCTATITGNRIIENFRGLYTSGWIKGKINDNLFDSNQFHGFDFFGDSCDLEIKGNTFTNNGWYAWPATELAGIYQGWYAYDPGTRISIENNVFQNNKVGLSLVKYYLNVSSPTTSYVTNNKFQDNEIGVLTCADAYANLEAVLTHNKIVDNQVHQIWLYLSQSPILNLGNLDNQSGIDDGANQIYGSSPYAVNNRTPFEIKAQGNYWNFKDSALIDQHIYDDEEDPSYGLVDFNYFSTWGELPPGTVWRGIVNVGGDVLIPEGRTLTIEPGAEIRFTAGIDGAQGGVDCSRAEMIVYGNIETVRGMGKDKLASPLHDYVMVHNDLEDGLSNIRCHPPARLTSDAYEPEPGDWYGIRFMNDKKRDINDWWIEYAFTGIEAALCKKLEIKDSKIDACLGFGIDFGGMKIEAKDCSLSYNQTGVRVNTNDFTLKDLVFKENKTGLSVETGNGSIKDNRFFNNDTGMVISVFQGAGDLTIKDNWVKENEIGIYVTTFGQTRDHFEQPLSGRCGDHLKIGRDNIFEHNAPYHIYNNTPDTVDARHNCWYPAQAESIAYRIYDYYDDSNLGIVIFEPDKRVSSGGPQGSENALLQLDINCCANPTRMVVVEYTVLDQQDVTISVYDISGRLIVTQKSLQEPGKHSFQLDNLANGVYFLKFETTEAKLIRKVIFIK